jgi:hypothetical protein
MNFTLLIIPDRWSLPKDLYMTIIICSLAAAVQLVSYLFRLELVC